ncbi:class I SAM-dependent methyltransferase [candidate division FCPU426 bacterium]|nr:class I SAM-dependent methyltransferase [candidate division FCPU426 bacterium]
MSPVRQEAYGQNRRPSWIDRLGICMSEKVVCRFLKSKAVQAGAVLDIGCGYQARLLSKLHANIHRGYGIDLAVEESLKEQPKLTFYEEPAEKALPRIPAETMDVVLMISVLEHLEHPLPVLTECVRVLKQNGLMLINVPTWAGKYFLEKSAFYFKLSPPEEMDDHKMYYNKRDLWPLLVKAGFKPSRLRLSYHKFGLNLFARCVK